MIERLVDSVRSIVDRFELSDLLELCVIGLVIYATMTFLRGTRGARLLRGFIFLLVGTTVIVAFLADVFQLERIKVLGPIFVAALFLIALVAFQPELRRALIRLGATGWIAASAREMDHVIDEVVSAVTYLAKNKIGALLAFERATEFGGLVESGCKLDAEVTERLLTTIFWPGSSLHDMGVIISQGRVAAAAVQFPLAESGELDPSLGSRHRAALGLSQESDALIVVVSEETGTISVVESGRFERYLTPDALRQLLRNKLGKPPKIEEADEEA